MELGLWIRGLPASGEGRISGLSPDGLQLLGESVEGALSHARGVLFDGGEADVAEPGEGAVVEPDDGDIGRHLKAGLADRVEDTDGSAVVAGNDCGGPVRAL